METPNPVIAPASPSAAGSTWEGANARDKFVVESAASISPAVQMRGRRGHPVRRSMQVPSSAWRSSVTAQRQRLPSRSVPSGHLLPCTSSLLLCTNSTPSCPLTCPDQRIGAANRSGPERGLHFNIFVSHVADPARHHAQSAFGRVQCSFADAG